LGVEWLATGHSFPYPPPLEEEAEAEASNGESDADKRLDEIEAALEQAESTPLAIEDSPEAPNARALADLKRIATDKSLPRGTRLRAALAGELGFDDEQLTRLGEELTNAAVKSTGSRFRQVTQDLTSAIDEVGYRPDPLIEEALKTAMFSHGLTRDGAVTLLSALQTNDKYR